MFRFLFSVDCDDEISSKKMGKAFGFHLSEANNQSGAGGGGTAVYSGGFDPNQEGGSILGGLLSNMAGAVAERAVGGMALSGIKKGVKAAGALMNLQRGGARTRSTSRRTRVMDSSPKGGVLDEPMVNEPESEDEGIGIPSPAPPTPSTSTSGGARRRPPVPPPPKRGALLYRQETDLQRTLSLMGMNKNLKGGKKTRVHRRIAGWKHHGSKAGEKFPGRLARLCRQGKIYAMLAFKEKRQNIPLWPRPGMARKFYNILSETEDFHGPFMGLAALMPKNAKASARRARAPARRAKRTLAGARVPRRRARPRAAGAINTPALTRRRARQALANAAGDGTQTGSGIGDLINKLAGALGL